MLRTENHATLQSNHHHHQAMSRAAWAVAIPMSRRLISELQQHAAPEPSACGMLAMQRDIPALCASMFLLLQQERQQSKHSALRTTKHVHDSNTYHNPASDLLLQPSSAAAMLVLLQKK
jgi:hypothetical protein